MDYFSELIESYNKLKKRTFKLVYLSEQEEAPPSNNVTQKATQLAQDAINNAPEMISTDAAQNGLTLHNVAQEPTALKIFKGLNNKGEPTGNTTVLGLGPQGGPLSVVKGEVQVPEAFDKLVARLSGEEKINSVEKSAIEQDQLRQQEEAMAEEAKLEPGGLFSAPENEGRFRDVNDLVRMESKLASQMEEACKNSLFKDVQEMICQEEGPKSYVGGNFRQSLERQLVEGGGIIVKVDEESGISYIEAATLDEKDPDLIYGILESQSELIDVFSKVSEEEVTRENCLFVKDRIATHKKGRIVIYSSPPLHGRSGEGVVLKPTALHKAILAKFDKCNIQQAIYEGVTNRRNEDKGRFNEAIFQLGIEFARASKIESDEERKIAIDRIGERLVQVVDRNLRKLLDLAQNIDLEGDVAIDLEDFDHIEEIYEQIEIYKDSKKLKNYIDSILGKNLAGLKEVDAAGSVPFGIRQALGMKTDTLLYFDSPEEAVQGAEKIGLNQTDVISKSRRDIVASLGGEYDKKGTLIPPKPPPTAPLGWKSDAEIVDERLQESFPDMGIDDAISVLNVGQKVSQGGQIRLGQLALRRSFLAGRGLDIDEKNDPYSKGGRAHPEDPKEYTRRLQGEKGVASTIDPDTGEEIPAKEDHSKFDITASPQEETDLETYSRALQRKYDAASKIGGPDSTIWKPDGEGITSMTAEHIATAVGRQIKKQFPVLSEKLGPFAKSVLATVMKTDAEGKPVSIDLSTPRTRKKLQEALQRDHLTSRLHNDLKGKNPQAKKSATLFMVRTAQMLVMNMEEMTQLVVEETGETFSLDQNEVVRQMSQATRNGNVTISPGRGKKASGTFLITFDMTVPNNNPPPKTKTHPVTISIGAERDSGNPIWTANINSEDARNVGTQLSKSKPQPENASMMYQYLKGQHQLLETLLNQAT